MFRRAPWIPALAGLALLLAAGAAGAHTMSRVASGPAEAPPVQTPLAPAPPSLAPAPAGTTLAWPALLVLAVLLLHPRRRAGRLGAACLAAALVVFAAESALHSAHHNDRMEATACQIASLATHVVGTSVAPVALAAPVLAVGAALVELARPAEPFRPLSPHQGRAPPSALA